MSFLQDMATNVGQLYAKTPGGMVLQKLGVLPNYGEEEEEEEGGPQDNRPQFMQQGGGGGGGQQAGQNIRPAGQTDPTQGAYGNSLRAWQGPSDPAGGAAPEGFTQATNPDGSWGAAELTAPPMPGGYPQGGKAGGSIGGAWAEAAMRHNAGQGQGQAPAPAPQAAMGQALRQPSAAPPPMGGPMGMQDPRKRRPFG